MARVIGSLFVFFIPGAVLAVEEPFWLPPSEAYSVLAPQTAAKAFVEIPLGPPEEQFIQYPDRPAPHVPPRKDKLTFYPCSQCHEYWETIPEPRKLLPVHDVGLVHGQGRLWCLVCHDPDDRDHLRTVRGDKVDFNDAWRVCGQCHSNRQKDWYYGAHGKRVSTWDGEPTRYNCTHCHNPHRPPIIQRKPQPKPPVRAGLEPMQRQVRHHQTVWEQHSAKREEVRHD
ncbi:MAG: cytochrome C [Pseudomonadota bacterium]